MTTPMLQVRDLHKQYPRGRSLFSRDYLQALAPISFDLRAGETLAFVGEAGSGRTSLAQVLSGAKARSGGQIILDGKELESQNNRQRSRNIRMIFQDPATSLNPRLRVGEQLEKPLQFNTNMSKSERVRAVEKALVQVGLLREHADFYPLMLANGQRQRVAIARALMLEPKILIADEAFGGLDTSLRAQCINLMLQLQRKLGLSYILMSHDLGLVRHISDRVIVLRKGVIVEQGDTADVFENPQHEYTKLLIEQQVLRARN
ncbi:ATP-binding cassette domain-containing protein [uncultured Ferrimonas sp.]|uniref:ATP-binding cassette domain-containing protein n=1 Tax=uncultured Ferrimonas sp. TaxID=432640 RepID=UPI002610B27E|nr:ATP-binding cassette domain-containing protein [uncultured Ferrimonas sp.]